MEAGKRVYESNPERVEDIVAQALEAFDANHVGRRESVKVDIAPDLPAAVRGPRRHRRRAGQPAHQRLQVLARARQDPPAPRAPTSATCASSVIDQGIGIARREHRRIFDKFYRSNELLSSDVEGSGLGPRHRAPRGAGPRRARGAGERARARAAPSRWCCRSPRGGRAQRRRLRARRCASRNMTMTTPSSPSSASRASWWSRTTPPSLLGLRMNLAAEGYEVGIAEDGRAGLDRAAGRARGTSSSSTSCCPSSTASRWCATCARSATTRPCSCSAPRAPRPTR